MRPAVRWDLPFIERKGQAKLEFTREQLAPQTSAGSLERRAIWKRGMRAQGRLWWDGVLIQDRLRAAKASPREVARMPWIKKVEAHYARGEQLFQGSYSVCSDSPYLRDWCLSHVRTF